MKKVNSKLTLGIIKLPHKTYQQGEHIKKMRRNQLTLPINTEMLIPKDDSVRLLDELTDQLDYSTILSMTSTTGVPAKYPPKLLFKILTYAYMNNIYSSRKIEKSCKRDINFMWLLEGKSAPDHNAINRFRNKLQEVIEDLFYQLVKLLGDNKEISYDNIFVDGTKLEANANKYSFVWRKSTLKHETRLQEKLKQLISVLNERYCTIFEITEEKVSVEEMEKVQNFLCKIKSEQNIEFVYGKGKRKHQIQRDMEEIGEMIEKQRKYDKYKGTFDGRNSFSKTDEDATFMHMKDDHMRNSQLKPGYNVQIGVEGEYIVGMDIFSERSDQLTLIPFLDKLEDNLPQKYKNIVADAGYESEENYVYLKRTKQTAYIKPSNYEKSKKRNYRKKNQPARKYGL